jgi:hypothetical protein
MIIIKQTMARPIELRKKVTLFFFSITSGVGDIKLNGMGRVNGNRTQRATRKLERRNKII